MRENRLSISRVAVGIGKSRPTVIAYKQGQYKPDYIARQKLERFSNGAVPASVWQTEEELREIEAVKPFDAERAA